MTKAADAAPATQRGWRAIPGGMRWATGAPSSAGAILATLTLLSLLALPRRERP